MLPYIGKEEGTTLIRSGIPIPSENQDILEENILKMLKRENAANTEITRINTLNKGGSVINSYRLSEERRIEQRRGIRDRRA